MAVKQAPMNADFAQGYAQEFLDEGTRREARWKSIVEIARTATHLTVEALVRIAFATKAPAAGYKHEKLAETYQTLVGMIAANDSTFNPERDARDLQFVCASVLRRLFGSKPDAALAVTTTSFGGHRKTNLSMDLTALAGQALDALSASQHTRIDVRALEIAAPKVEFTVSDEAAQNNSGWKAEIEGLRNATALELSAIVTRQNEVTRAMARRLALADEELQMLWWLMGGRSQQLNIPFGKIEPNIQPLLLGKELGRLTTVAPGPASVGAMLTQAGLATRKIKVEEAVNAADVAWAATMSQQEAISPATTPLHFALEKRAELDSTDAWKAGWEAQTGLSASLALPAVQLAHLFYLEHLFLHVNA